MSTVTIKIVYNEEDLAIGDLPYAIKDLDPAIESVTITQVTEVTQ